VLFCDAPWREFAGAASVSTLLFCDCNMPIQRALTQPFIEAITSSPFWQSILRDQTLQPEVRDPQCLTVYYMGGALLQNIRQKRGRIIAETHHKYVPISPSPSVKFLGGETQNGFCFAGYPQPVPPGVCNGDVLDLYKRCIENEAGREERVRQAIVADKRNRIIDQEIALGEANFVDLCFYFKRKGQHGTIGLAELKHIKDPRLFPLADADPEAIRQLDRYGQRIAKDWAFFQGAFTDCIASKLRLGLGSRLRDVPVDVRLPILRKPLLVIGGCSNRDVEMILAGHGKWQRLRQLLPEVTSGLIPCGNNGCVLRLGRQNAVMFDDSVFPA